MNFYLLKNQFKPIFMKQIYIYDLCSTKYFRVFDYLLLFSARFSVEFFVLFATFPSNFFSINERECEL